MSNASFFNSKNLPDILGPDEKNLNYEALLGHFAMALGSEVDTFMNIRGGITSTHDAYGILAANIRKLTPYLLEVPSTPQDYEDMVECSVKVATACFLIATELAPEYLSELGASIVDQLVSVRWDTLTARSDRFPKETK